MNSHTQKAKKYNIANYKRYAFRVRNGTALCKKLEEYHEEGEYSVNFLITKLLCEHFGTDLPNIYYEHRARSPLACD